MGRFFSGLGAFVDRAVNKQVRRDLLALAGFLAAGYILSTNLNVVRTLDALAMEYDGLQLDRVFGTLIVAALGLMLYGFSRSHTTLKALNARVEADERARRIAMHDQLTGLPNRRHLKGLVNFLLSENDGSRKMAVMLVNLDRFKAINDHYGRAVGDELLVAVGKLLNHRAGVDGFVARFDQDEFAVVIQDRNEDYIIDWLSSFLTVLEQPIALTNATVTTGATVGIAMAIADGRDAETLLKRADIALRRAKEGCRGWFAFFKTGMDERAHDRAVFEHDLWMAIRNDEIEPWFQPLASLEDGKTRGYEILARWPHPERGVVPPDQFIALAEAAGLIGDLTLNVLRRACREAVGWEGAPHISLNLAPAQLQDADLAKRLLKILTETGFPPARLEVEITEGALVTDFETARATLTSLKNQGVRIALDNFGTGHSSLRQLRELPFDKLKIDRSFVDTMASNDSSAVLVRTMVTMAKNLGLGVVAEGVETPEQAKMLLAFGCDYGQGHHFGKAAPGAEYHPVTTPAPMPRRAAKPAPVEAAGTLVATVPAPATEAPQKLEKVS